MSHPEFYRAVHDVVFCHLAQNPERSHEFKQPSPDTAATRTKQDVDRKPREELLEQKMATLHLAQTMVYKLHYTDIQTMP